MEVWALYIVSNIIGGQIPIHRVIKKLKISLSDQEKLQEMHDDFQKVMNTRRNQNPYIMYFEVNEQTPEENNG